MTSSYFEEFTDSEQAENEALETATGEQVRAALRPYLDHLREVAPDRVLLLGDPLTSEACGAEWIAAFRAPTRFGWKGARWPAPLADEICTITAGLEGLQNDALDQARRALGISW